MRSKSILVRKKLSNLYSNLIQNEFRFLGKGEFDLQTILSAVKKRFSNLCDDNYMCYQSCSHGAKNTPEWQHRVRAALGRLKDTERNVRKGVARNYWVIGV